MKKNRILLASMMSLVGVLGFSGCGENNSSVDLKPSIEEYEAKFFVPYEVQEEWIETVVYLDLHCNSYGYEKYYPYRDGLVVDNVNVSQGTVFHKGDILLSYKTEEIEKKLKAYEEEIETNQMMYDHYLKLNEIEPSESLRATLDQLKRSIDADRMHVEELRNRITEQSIIAKENGIVNLIEKDLKNRVVTQKTELFTVTYSDGIYIADTRDVYDLEEGEIYESPFGLTTLKFVYKGMEEFDPAEVYEGYIGSEDGEEELMYRYTFEYYPEESPICTKWNPSIIVKKVEMGNQLCIPEYYIERRKEGDLVYILNEDGNIRAQWIEIETVVDSKAIIKSGLTKGDKVIKR